MKGEYRIVVVAKRLQLRMMKWQRTGISLLIFTDFNLYWLGGFMFTVSDDYADSIAKIALGLKIFWKTEFMVGNVNTILR